QVFVPLLFPVAALSLPGAITTLLTTGQGSGAIGLVLFGMLGGIALGPVRHVRRALVDPVA
ncbi:MAG TPA: hypothetical protein VGJ95_16660, partial [Pseudonocardiaceae bacterium]